MFDPNEIEQRMKRILSEAQLESNRRNAQKSTGAKTEAGKKKSRANAVKHGHRASVTVLPNENPALFERVCEDYYKALKPIDAVECRLVNDAVTASWRLDRSIRCESAVLTKKVHQSCLIEDLQRHEEFNRMRRELFENPRKVHIELRNTVLGCEWMVRELQAILKNLETRKFWYVSERDRVLNILGLNTEDLFFDSLAFDIVEAFISGGWAHGVNGDILRVQALIRTGPPEGIAVWEYRHRVQGLTDRVGDFNPDAARARLVELVAPHVEVLKKRLEHLRPYETGIHNFTREREMVDVSHEGQLRTRYEMMHRRDFHKSLRELENYRKTFDNNELNSDESAFTGYGRGNFAAPNEPEIAAPERPVPNPEVPQNGPEKPKPDIENVELESRKRLGMPPVPNHRLNELIDHSIPDLNRLLMWADELEDERNKKAQVSEVPM